ncbi:uncharacterized protein CPUR_05148 [Claviceps purpurea 20.1]|uniref:Uncharacterized protein n=1 Tax=Claviceps purpurea (strain 20.1) TaxID=1111077 RepID=M1VWH8_CLAP2|nr:uncharacterized protein CPUR_05148 [Claviceps purpurea 20.1]
MAGEGTNFQALLDVLASSPPPNGKLENAALSTTTSFDVDADVDGACSSTVLLVRGRK